MNLSLIKFSAEAAKESSSELELWQMEISPDDVLRLVEVARYALEHRQMTASQMADSHALFWATERLHNALEGIEP